MKKNLCMCILALSVLVSGSALAKAMAVNDEIRIYNNSNDTIYYLINSFILGYTYAVSPHSSDIYHQKVSRSKHTTIYAGKCLERNTIGKIGEHHIFGSLCETTDGPLRKCSDHTYNINKIHNISIDSNYNCSVN